LIRRLVRRLARRRANPRTKPAAAAALPLLTSPHDDALVRRRRASGRPPSRACTPVDLAGLDDGTRTNTVAFGAADGAAGTFRPIEAKEQSASPSSTVDATHVDADKLGSVAEEKKNGYEGRLGEGGDECATTAAANHITTTARRGRPALAALYLQTQCSIAATAAAAQAAEARPL
jgi:hypothetical protein